MAKVRKTRTCWLWTGYIAPSGYAMFNLAGTPELAHRVSYKLFVGPIPEGLTIDHVRARGCRHRHCVRPSHLDAVTLVENRLRGTHSNQWAKRTHCVNGHEFTEENTYRPPSNPTTRQCRACKAERDTQRRRAK